MKLSRKYQAGGEMAAPAVEQAAPAEQPMEQGGDVLMQLADMFMQGLQAQDCSMLAQGAEMFLELIQQAQGAAEQQPVFGKGGKIASRRPASIQLVVK